MRDWFEWRSLPNANFAVIGDPISHSRSPGMHTAAYEALALGYRYVAIRVPLEEFSQAMDAITKAGYLGVNVTLPLKEAAFDWAAGGDPRMGAVNTIRIEDRSGINTDAPGFLRTLTELGVRPCRVMVLGAGGSARALCVALHDAGYDVCLFNRTPERAHQLVRDSKCDIKVLDSPDPTSCGLVINATSAGINQDSPNLLWERVERDALAYDLLYSQEPTPFLMEAANRGLRGVDGKRMLLMQGALAFEWWTGQEAPQEAMMKALD